MEYLELLTNQLLISEINVEPIIDRYAEIDAFSQGKLANMKLEGSAKNMGENDLWIAATASILNLKLLTTDKDFSHLQTQFIDLELIALS